MEGGFRPLPPVHFLEFHLPACTVSYIQTFTTWPVESLVRDFLATSLASDLPFLLPVPSWVTIGCFSVLVTDSVTVVFSVSASDLAVSALESLLLVLLDDWTAYLRLLHIATAPLTNARCLDLSLIELSSLILLPTEEQQIRQLV